MNNNIVALPPTLTMKLARKITILPLTSCEPAPPTAVSKGKPVVGRQSVSSSNFLDHAIGHMIPIMMHNSATKVNDVQRDRILRIAAGLFAKKGYQAVGVAELGDKVGLGRGALYYHIGSKEELLYDIIIKYIRDLVLTGTHILQQKTDPQKKIELLSQHMMETISANVSEMTVCFRESDCLTGDRHKSVARLHSDYQNLWSKVFDEGLRKGVFRRLSPVALKGLLGMYFHSCLWFSSKGKNSATQIADVFSDIVLRALAPDAAPSNKKPQSRG